jgi:hypothetical protein
MITGIHPASGLTAPLALFITEGKSRLMIEEGLNCVERALQKIGGGWGGTGGPDIVMIDNDGAEIGAVETIWPAADWLLCSWHCSEAFYKNVRRADRGIIQEDQEYLYKLFQKILYTPHYQEARDQFNRLRKEASRLCGQDLAEYIDNVWTKNFDHWIHSARDHRCRNQHTNNRSV